MDTQKDGLEKVSPFIHGHFGVYICQIVWGVVSQNGPTISSFIKMTQPGTLGKESLLCING